LQLFVKKNANTLACQLANYALETLNTFFNIYAVKSSSNRTTIKHQAYLRRRLENAIGSCDYCDIHAPERGCQ